MAHSDAPKAATAAAMNGQPPSQPAVGCGEQQCGDQACGSGSDAPPAAAEVAGRVCMKCRKQPAQLVARGREPLCHLCLHDQLLSKVRNAVRLHALILPGDALALAFSGGQASAALLHFLSGLRNPCADRPARGKVAFTLHIIHIDESAVAPPGLDAQQAGAALASVAAAAQPYCGHGVQYHCVPLEATFAAEASAVAAENGSSVADEQGGASERQRARLRVLMATVGDTTGRQDLTRHLRSHLLLRTAAALGCGRLARGDCATALATHIVAAAAKGCGYSLAGDVRLVDARHGDALPAVFLPLREVSARELAMVCSHWRLPLARRPALPEAAARAAERSAKKSINSLAAAFIEGMESHNPGSVPNILSTISKLRAFPWNESAAPSQAARQQQQQQQQQQPSEWPAAVLCPICLAPLADDELPGGSSAGASSGSEHTSGGTGVAVAATSAGCCLSCYTQILGGASAAAVPSAVAAALPGYVQQRMAGLAAAGSHVGAAQDGVAEQGGGGAEHLRAAIAEFLLE